MTRDARRRKALGNNNKRRVDPAPWPTSGEFPSVVTADRFGRFRPSTVQRDTPERQVRRHHRRHHGGSVGTVGGTLMRGGGACGIPLNPSGKTGEDDPPLCSQGVADDLGSAAEQRTPVRCSDCRRASPADARLARRHDGPRKPLRAFQRGDQAFGNSNGYRRLRAVGQFQ